MLNEEELKHLKEVIDSITTHIPEHQAGYVWSMYGRLDKDHGPQPCMCSSAGRHWKAAVDYLRNYLKKND